MTANIRDDQVTMPLGRTADPYEIATFVLFLASDGWSYAAGAEFTMAGGPTAAVPHEGG
jgi:3alpha(or 20beta)-hydroxysteroid dehydrogenase